MRRHIVESVGLWLVVILIIITVSDFHIASVFISITREVGDSFGSYVKEFLGPFVTLEVPAKVTKILIDKFGS